MSFTVSAAITSQNGNGALKVFVTTGTAEAGGNAAGMAAYAAANASLTPAQSGSLILFGILAVTGVYAAQVAEASNTFTDNAATGTSGYADGHYTGTVTSGTPVTIGASGPGGQWDALGAYELIPSGSPAIDASTPAAYTGNTSPFTSAAFTPPAGSVLAAVVMFEQSVSGTAPAITDTSGLGLTWTQRALYPGNAYAASVAVFTAKIPSSGATATPAAVTASAAFPSPAVRQDKTAAPSVTAASAAFPSPVVRQDQAIAPSALAASAAFPAAAVSRSTVPGYASAFGIVSGGSGSWVGAANAEGAPDGTYAIWVAP